MLIDSIRGNAMILHLAILKNSLYACNIRVTDANGARFYHVSQDDVFNGAPSFLNVEISGNECDIAIAPIMPSADFKWDDETEKNSFWNRLADKCGKSLLSLIDQLILRVTCEYHLSNLADGDCVDIIGREYIYGAWDKWDLCELLPMAFAFYEVEHHGKIPTLNEAFGTNRIGVIKTARKLALFDTFGYGLAVLLSYPFQIGRIKYLSSKRKVFRTIKKFNKMTPEERKKFEEQMDKKF